MTEIFNRWEFTDRRRDLRRTMTRAEVFLWSKLKGKQLNGLKFRRQYGIGQYVADFYCPECSLVIELDGEIHSLEPVAEHDKWRQEYIESLGLKVLRYTNQEVFRNIEGVLQDIAKHATPSPPYEGGD